eukprot:gene10726-2817_t
MSNKDPQLQLLMPVLCTISFQLLPWLPLMWLLPRITLSCAKGALPLEWFPKWSQDLNKFYIRDFKDPLMGANQKPIWFKSFIYCELFLQLPFFGLALYAMHTGGSWIRIPGIIYGTHVCTTVVAVLADVLCGDHGMYRKIVLLLKT